MSNKAKLDVRSLSIAGILCALIGAMTLVPQTGYIAIPALQISITTLHVPVIIGAILLGPGWGAVIGGFWGITCMLKAFAMPPSVLDLLFRNPLYSVAPRIMVGLIAALVYRALSARLGEKRRFLSFYLTGMAGAITNSALVLGFLALFSAEALKVLGGSLWAILGIVLTVNGLLEIIVAPILISAAAAAVFSALKRRV